MGHPNSLPPSLINFLTSPGPRRSDSKRASLSASCPDLPQTLYAPKCICIVSSFPFFSTFKVWTTFKL